MKRNYVYTIMLVALVLVFILKVFLEAKKMPVINTIVAVVFFMLVPLCMNIILILIPTNGINLYMKHHYILAFGLMFALLERFEESVAKNLCLWVSVIHSTGNRVDKGYDWYGFFALGLKSGFIIVPIIILITFGISFVLWKLNRSKLSKTDK